MLQTLFHEISLVLLIAGGLSLIVYILRQPLIVAYIITGLLIGPSVLGLTSTPEVFETMSQIGIAFLLFLVGINLNWRNIKDIGGVSFFAGMGQVIFTSIFGYFIAQALNFSVIESWVLSVSFAFSSTIVIVKLLSDKQDLDRFYGRLAVGTLIVQDIAAMIVLIFIATLRDTGSNFGDMIAFSIGKGLVVVISLLLLAKYILPTIFKFAARSQELLFIVAIAWCFSVASVLLMLGFGIEIGALLAGITLAGSTFHSEIEHKIRPLRDFFIILFFIVLGTHLSPEFDPELIKQAAIFSAFILIGNPLILLIILRLFGYHPRTGFLVGVTMAQISEFSFIVITALITAGFVGTELLPLATMVGMITIVVSTYIIMYSEQIYEKIEPLFYWLETQKSAREHKLTDHKDIILIGCDGLGQKILRSIQGLKKSYAIIDFNPHKLKELSAQEEPIIYGDAGNTDFLFEHNVHRAKMIISTVGDPAVNQEITRFIAKKNPKAVIIVSARKDSEKDYLYHLGATFVVIAKDLGGHFLGDILSSNKFRKSSWKKMLKESIST
jgi:Kef-type K+ transport system membrane component KefB